MTTEPMTQIERQRQKVAQIREQLRVIREEANTRRDAFATERTKARAGDKKAAARCEELDEELTALSVRGFALSRELDSQLRQLGDLEQRVWPARALR